MMFRYLCAYWVIKRLVEAPVDVHRKYNNREVAVLEKIEHGAFSRHRN